MSRFATLISVVPFPIIEFKPGIYPGFFEIPASRDLIPQLLTIGESVYHVEIDENRTITVKCSPDDVAKSVVNDYVISNLAYSIENEAAPGVMWVPDKLDLGQVLSKYSKELEKLKRYQRNWFMELIKMADDDWEKTRQHKCISDMQRYAAKALGQERPWIITPINTIENTIKCIACQSVISPEAIICPFCKCVMNMEKYKTLKFAEV